LSYKQYELLQRALDVMARGPIVLDAAADLTDVVTSLGLPVTAAVSAADAAPVDTDTPAMQRILSVYRSIWKRKMQCVAVECACGVCCVCS
jgi:hypothetical protein